LAKGATIATIHSQEDNDAVIDALQAEGCAFAYIGAYANKLDNWSWDDGSEWDYENPGRNEMHGWEGNLESRIVVMKDGNWADWGTG